MSGRIQEFLSAVLEIPPIGWGLFFILLILLVVMFQLYVIQRQQLVLRSHLKLVDRQNKLLSRRSELQMRCETNFEKYELEFLVENTGNGSAEDSYWHLSIPMWLCRGPMRQNGSGLPYPSTVDRIGETSFLRIGGYGKESIYPSCSKRLGTIRIADPLPPAGRYRIEWLVVSNDGSVTGEGTNSIEISVPAGASDQ